MPYKLELRTLKPKANKQLLKAVQLIYNVSRESLSVLKDIYGARIHS